MIRTSWINDQPIKVVASYSVSGRNGDADFPYLHDLPSLRAAIEKARHYRGTNTGKGAGRVQRQLTVYMPNSDTQTASGWQTHEWFVHANGRIELSEWRKRVRSPARAVRERIERDERHAILMNDAAERDSQGLSPDDYNQVVLAVLRRFIRSARTAGFCVVYQTHHGEQRPVNAEHRDEGEQRLVRQINEDLARQGFRTLEEAGLRNALGLIPDAKMLM